LKVSLKTKGARAGTKKPIKDAEAAFMQFKNPKE
jgi:hypothetical protein